MQLICCETLFDITATGVRSNYKTAHVPFVDTAGNTITDLDSWNKARNQQRNWETIIQVISLRTLPENITTPTRIMHNDKIAWQFNFEVNDVSALSANSTTFSELLADCQNVPMLTKLNESIGLDSSLIVSGNKINIWFKLLDTK